MKQRKQSNAFFMQLFASILGIFICTFLFLPTDIYGQEGSEKPALVAEIYIEQLHIKSYSTKWTEDKLYMLYDELISNHHGEEFKLLAAITLYPTTTEGVLGYYIEDTTIQKGKIVFGSHAAIELYHADAFDTIEKIAPLLSHEYGHHYTIVNMTKYEQLYYPNWDKASYTNIRDLSHEPVFFSSLEENYRHMWDITEIVANDYVQLLGSYHARAPYPYKSVDEMVESGAGEIWQPRAFNLQPQENMNLPLATEIDGLYEYLLGISGMTKKGPEMKVKPLITNIVQHKDQYTIFFHGPDNSDYSYTVVMYKKGAIHFPEPVKWLSPLDARYAMFGTYFDVVNGETLITKNSYEGIYEFRVYAQDDNGFIFSSSPYLYDFGAATIETTPRKASKESKHIQELSKETVTTISEDDLFDFSVETEKILSVPTLDYLFMASGQAFLELDPGFFPTFQRMTLSHTPVGSSHVFIQTGTHVFSIDDIKNSCIMPNIVEPEKSNYIIWSKKKSPIASKEGESLIKGLSMSYQKTPLLSTGIP